MLELKRLLVDLKEKRPDICVRYRLLGEMWGVNFMRVIHITEKRSTDERRAEQQAGEPHRPFFGHAVRNRCTFSGIPAPFSLPRQAHV